jgi:EAL domain-containing protein (putative c-di-GMP-specific phosphodiesterase class I)
MKKFALLIGVSEYQEDFNPLPSAINDITAMQRILKEPGMGGFDKIKVLPNPNLETMRYEIEHLFAGECGRDDLVLLYFSGHGIKDNDNKLYFATSGTRKKATGELSVATAVEADFIHGVMASSRAKRQVIILDCCFSGAFDPSLQAKDDGSFDLRGQLGAEGRVVLASSSSTQYSFEQKEGELSIYTRHLVEGIETGAADDNGNGEISIAELHEYLTQKVQDEIPKATPKIIVIKEQGYDIILSKAKVKVSQKDNAGTADTDDIVTSKIDIGLVNLDIKQNSKSNYYEAIPSLLLSIKPFTERLIEQLRSHYLSQNREKSSLKIETNRNYILELIRRAANVDFVFLMSSVEHTNTWMLKSQSTLSKDVSEYDYTEIIKTKILTDVSVESIFTTGCHGIYRTYYDEKKGASKAFILIPTESLSASEFVVICGLSKDSDYLNDAFARTIISFYTAAQNYNLNPALVEAAILDDLKDNYGFLPIAFYNRRFELFCERLEQVEIHFEPILDLKKVDITGWEALARDPETLTAPLDLFNAAKLWGRRFTIQLDMALLQRAVESYRTARIKAKMNRPNDIVNLSVNVYPESLMRTNYFEAVRKIVTPDQTGYPLLPADNLVLEISEKTDLPTHSNGVYFPEPLKAFKNRLLEYTHDLEVRFGIDDFGVGYASVSRLAGLRPPFVKIDRDILHQDQSDIIIKFVREIVRRSSELHITQVIIEGLDEESPVKLDELKELGVTYVQGYVVGESGPDIYRLPREKREALWKLIHNE